eukprot:gene23449-28448_t
MLRQVSLRSITSVVSIGLLDLVAHAEASDSSAKGLVGPRTTFVQNVTQPQGSSGFYVVYDHQTRTPLYTVEKLTKESVAGENGDKVAKRPPFFAEQTVDELFRVHPKDYTDSKYDRGHLTPAADFQHLPDAYYATFSMSNIAPQAPVLNKNFWAKFENWIRVYLLGSNNSSNVSTPQNSTSGATTKNTDTQSSLNNNTLLLQKAIFDEVLIITGPVYAPVFFNNTWVYLHKTVGYFPNLIKVPSHFYKVIVGKRNIATSGGTSSNVVGVFLVPNNNSVSKDEPIFNYLVRLDQLESILGYRILPTLLSPTPPPHTKSPAPYTTHHAHLDAFVPPHRDLSILLNAQTSLAGAGGVGRVTLCDIQKQLKGNQADIARLIDRCMIFESLVATLNTQQNTAASFSAARQQSVRSLLAFFQEVQRQHDKLQEKTVVAIAHSLTHRSSISADIARLNTRLCELAGELGIALQIDETQQRREDLADLKAVLDAALEEITLEVQAQVSVAAGFQRIVEEFFAARGRALTPQELLDAQQFAKKAERRVEARHAEIVAGRRRLELQV